MGGQDFSQCQGKRICAMYPKGSDIPPSSPSSPCFWLDLRVACSYIPSRHLPSLRLAICDLATGQVLPVGEFIRHMPVTLLSRIHFQINRRSSWAFKREFRSRCAKLPLPKIFQSRLLRRDSSKWMRHFRIFKILKIIFFFSGIKTTVRRTD